MRDAERETVASAAPATGAVRATIDIAAPADAVFRALVEPDQLAAWLGGGEPASDDAAPSPERGETRDAPEEAAVGRRWRAPALSPDGTLGSVSGEYLVVDPPRRLETTWRASWSDLAPERVRFELAPVEVGGAAGTRVSVTHTRALRAHTTAQHGARAAALTGVAWSPALARLAAHVMAAVVIARWEQEQPHGTSPAGWFDAVHRAVVAIHQRD